MEEEIKSEENMEELTEETEANIKQEDILPKKKNKEKKT